MRAKREFGVWGVVGAKPEENLEMGGGYVSRKETRSEWSERKYKVILVGRDMMNNRYYKLDGMSKRYNRHELLLVD